MALGILAGFEFRQICGRSL